MSENLRKAKLIHQEHKLSTAPDPDQCSTRQRAKQGHLTEPRPSVSHLHTKSCRIMSNESATNEQAQVINQPNMMGAGAHACSSGFFLLSVDVIKVSFEGSSHQALLFSNSFTLLHLYLLFFTINTLQNFHHHELLSINPETHNKREKKGPFVFEKGEITHLGPSFRRIASSRGRPSGSRHVGDQEEG